MKSNKTNTRLFATMTILITSIMLLNFNSAKAVGPLGLHFKAGLSTPNDMISKVYSNENLTSNNIGSGNFFTENADMGYHLGVAARIELSDMFHFVGGVEFHRFPRSEFKIKDPQTGEIHQFKSTQNIFPIHAGINLAFINTNLVNVYATGGFAYNYISNSVDYVTDDSDYSVPLDMSPTDSRIGYFLGAGTDLDLQLLKLNLELKYQHINLIGKDSGEPDKQFLAISLGVIL
ncbi:MAG: outer membrane beta-barrel protein [Ignavibacteriae bacterium]|nr:outer membrane beta-barrel protein [Ignavibacteriota bacterium]MCB9221075.1 outer membrane beta-barrel protein [Ignavibacteria bacterium]